MKTPMRVQGIHLQLNWRGSEWFRLNKPDEI
jgi:hypothetical protein